MKEAMEIMPETLEYGVISANVLLFLKNVVCQVTVHEEGISAFCKVQALWFVNATRKVQEPFRPRAVGGPSGRAASSTD